MRAPVYQVFAAMPDGSGFWQQYRNPNHALRAFDLWSRKPGCTGALVRAYGSQRGDVRDLHTFGNINQFNG